MLARIRKAIEEKDQGFTLIELLVVIIIIGILAAIAIPVFLNQRKKGVDASIKSDLKNMATAEETYITDNPSETGAYYTGGAFTFKTDNATAVSNPPAYKSSPGNTIVVTVKSGVGYCIQGTNANSDATGSPNSYWYDSALGGLVTTPGAKPTTTGTAC